MIDPEEGKKIGHIESNRWRSNQAGPDIRTAATAFLVIAAKVDEVVMSRGWSLGRVIHHSKKHFSIMVKST